MITYKVMLSSNANSLPEVSSKTILAIEPEDYTAKEISELKEKGYTLLGYLSLGSVSDERSYYSKLEKYTLDKLEDWEHERYLDIRKTAVQEWAVSRAKEIIKMGFDGLWIDNLDVYEYYKSAALFNAIVSVLKQLKSFSGYIMINGGKEFIETLMDKSQFLYKVQLGAYRYKSNAEKQCREVKQKGFNAIVVHDVYYKVQIGAFANKTNAENQLKKVKDKGYQKAIIVKKGTNYTCVDGVTQEEVFSLITDYSDTGKFGTQSKSEREAYQKYLTSANNYGIDTFLLEYTKDKDLKRTIISYCNKNGITGYCISEDVDL